MSTGAEGLSKLERSLLEAAQLKGYVRVITGDGAKAVAKLADLGYLKIEKATFTATAITEAKVTEEGRGVVLPPLSDP